MSMSNQQTDEIYDEHR